MSSSDPEQALHPLAQKQCPVPDPADGLPVTCVGNWAEEKMDYLVEAGGVEPLPPPGRLQARKEVLFSRALAKGRS